MRIPVSVRSDYALSNDQIRAVAPSIFAAQPHESRSARYTYLPTVEVLDALRGEGFMPFSAGQSLARDPGKRAFTKHMIRLRKADGPSVKGDSLPEIVLLNSHDGSSAYRVMAGIFRMVCSNGMIVPSSLVGDIRVHHKGDVAREVIEGVYSVVEQFDKVLGAADRFKSIQLAPPESMALAQAGIVAKYGRSESGAYPVRAEQVLQARRYDDRGNDLWTTFNRVQENLIRGGLRARTANGRRATTRGVKGISQNVELNQALWTLADEMAKLKVAA